MTNLEQIAKRNIYSAFRLQSVKERLLHHKTRLKLIQSLYMRRCRLDIVSSIMKVWVKLCRDDGLVLNEVYVAAVGGAAATRVGGAPGFWKRMPW